MFGDDFVQAVTDRVTFAVQHFDGQVILMMMILMIILMIMMMMMIIIMVMVMIIMEVMIMKIRFLTGT